MRQQDMSLLLLKVEQSAFIQAFFMASTSARVAFKWPHLPLAGKQTAGCESPHDWLMSLAMDLAALCDMWR